MDNHKPLRLNSQFKSQLKDQSKPSVLQSAPNLNQDNEVFTHASLSNRIVKGEEATPDSVRKTVVIQEEPLETNHKEKVFNLRAVWDTRVSLRENHAQLRGP